MAGIIKTYYDRGQLKEEYFENDGKKEGKYKLYHKSGQLWEICNYDDGKKMGNIDFII